MTQDTRKDPRAKVLTMTVRYKSATVDEFIEQYSLDISRGGIFIKTSSPFAPGTLLKFEIRIAEERTVLQGVGRVVWKRDPADAIPSRPAGMGVKFIKLDEASRQVIDRLVARYKDAGSAYEAGLKGASVTAAAAPSTEGEAAPGPVRKATMIGLGGLDAAAVIAAAQAEAAGAGAEKTEQGTFFPPTDSEAEMPPPGERTVMRQAAELLQEALLGAGGTIDEIGSLGATPLVDETGRNTTLELPKSSSISNFPPPNVPASTPSLEVVTPRDSLPNVTVSPSEQPSSEPPVSGLPSEPPLAEAAAPLKPISDRPQPPPPVVEPPKPPREIVSRPEPAAAKSGGNRGLIYLGLVAAVAAGLYFMLRGSPSEAGGDTQATTAETAEPAQDESPAQAAEPETIEQPAPTASAEPTSPEPAETGETAEPAASAEAPQPVQPAVAPAEPQPEPKPAKVEPTTPAPQPTTKTPKAPSTTKAPSTQATTTTPKPAATPTEKPAAKAPAPSDDNPY